MLKEKEVEKFRRRGENGIKSDMQIAGANIQEVKDHDLWTCRTRVTDFNLLSNWPNLSSIPTNYLYSSYYSLFHLSTSF